MKNEQLLRDIAIEPTDEVIASCLESTNSTYLKFIDQLQNYDIELNWRYYNDGKAWLAKGLNCWTTSRGTKKEKTIFWLSLWSDFFKVTVFIPEKNRLDALELPLNNETIKMVKEAKQMGKLKFFPIVFNIYSDEMFIELLTIIDFRKNLK